MAKLSELTPDEFHRFQRFIYAASGISIPDSKLTLLSNRIRRRLKDGDFENFESYFRYLNSMKGRQELPSFLDAVTTNETFFFRTESHFDWLSKDYLNQMTLQARAGRRPKSLRIWSAACSTGEEPYSIAICIAENQLRLRDWEIEIVGTDLSEQALATARSGIYAGRSMQNLDDKRRRRYFSKVDEGEKWQIKPALQELTAFERHNLMDPMTHGPFDCIFIRNVLIYFDRKSKQKVVGHLIDALSPGGFLIVGPSEGIFDMLDPLTKQSSFCYRK